MVRPTLRISFRQTACRADPAAQLHLTPRPCHGHCLTCAVRTRSYQCNSTASFDRVFSRWRSFQPSCRTQVEGGRSRGWSVPGVRSCDLQRVHTSSASRDQLQGPESGVSPPAACCAMLHVAVRDNAVSGPAAYLHPGSKLPQ